MIDDDEMIISLLTTNDYEWGVEQETREREREREKNTEFLFLIHFRLVKRDVSRKISFW